MLHVLVGSTRPAKVDGVRDALAAVAGIDASYADAAIETYDLTDVAPRMPMTTAEIVDGARRRATELVARHRQRRPGNRILAVGLEGGLAPLDASDGGGQHVLATWAAVTDGRHWGCGAGPSILIPAAILREVAAGAELGDVVDRLAGEAVRGSRGAWGVLTRDLVGRREAFRLAVVSALAPFYNAALYSTGPRS